MIYWACTDIGSTVWISWIGHQVLGIVLWLVISISGQQLKTVQEKVIWDMMILDIGLSYLKISSEKGKKQMNIFSKSTIMWMIMIKETMVSMLKI